MSFICMLSVRLLLLLFKYGDPITMTKCSAELSYYRTVELQLSSILACRKKMLHIRLVVVSSSWSKHLIPPVLANEAVPLYTSQILQYVTCRTQIPDHSHQGVCVCSYVVLLLHQLLPVYCACYAHILTHLGIFSGIRRRASVSFDVALPPCQDHLC